MLIGFPSVIQGATHAIRLYGPPMWCGELIPLLWFITWNLKRILDWFNQFQCSCMYGLLVSLSLFLFLYIYILCVCVYFLYAVLL